MIAAAAAVILRTSALPRWLGWSGMAIALAIVATSPVTVTSPGIAEIPIQLVILWLVATSMTMLVRAGRGNRPAGTDD